MLCTFVIPLSVLLSTIGLFVDARKVFAIVGLCIVAPLALLQAYAMTMYFCFSH